MQEQESFALRDFGAKLKLEAATAARLNETDSKGGRTSASPIFAAAVGHDYLV